jgi:hypothetical protein
MTTRSIARQLFSQVNLLVLLVPVLFTLAVGYFVGTGQFSYEKEQLEVFAFFILVPFTALGFVRFFAERRLIFLWLSVLLGALLCREIHFPGTSAGIAIALGLLLVTLRYRYDALRDGFSTPLLVNLLVAGFAAYFISELMLDHNWARIPRHFAQEYKFRSVLEETVELLGHFLLAVTVVVAPAPRERSEGGSQ